MINKMINEIISQGFENFQQSRKAKSREKTNSRQNFRFYDNNDNPEISLNPRKRLIF
jgi:hypothetical protein